MIDESPVGAAEHDAGSTPLAPSGLCDLASMAVVDVSGTEVETFLQGQFCNDIKRVSGATPTAAGTAILNGYCTPKGRLLALPIVMATASGLRLIVPEALQESLLKRLRMFVMRADVTFTPRPDLALLGLQSAEAQCKQLLPESLRVPMEPMSVQGEGDTQALCWFSGEGGVSRWLLVLPAAEAQVLKKLIEGAGPDAQALPVRSEAFWRLGNIHAGIAEVVEATSDSFIPQMLNLQQVGALSFTKGCYPGQEIVARMQYLGKLKRHMVHLFLPSGANAPAPGDAIGTAESDKAAEIVSSVEADDGIHMLAVVRIGNDPGDLVFQGHNCSLVELPYELAPAKA